MALIVRYLDDINRYLNRYEDSRTSKFFLMSSPFYTLAICLTYVFIVKVVGPKLMDNRKPYKLKNTLIVYNFLQVVFSIYLFVEIGMSGWLTGKYNWKCQPVDYSNSADSIRVVNASWWYYFSKFTEFFDTIFFVLRKKNDHISTLHVIHHGVMPMSVWFGVKFTPGGHSTFFGFLNTFVHIIMYTYYMLSAFGPKIQKYLWWKKYLTALQLIQFVGIMVHAFQLLFIDCNYPRAFVWWIGMHAVMFFFLFRDFYNQSYNKMTARRQRISTGDEIKPTDSSKTNGLSQENGHLIANGKSNHNHTTEEIGQTNMATKNGVNYYALNNGELHQRSRTLH